MTKLDEYLMIKDAADFLGVSAHTLRNWGTSGKLNMHRNPLNGYRLFKIKDLQQVLEDIEESGRSSGTPRKRPRSK